jgi:hypothetical protein
MGLTRLELVTFPLSEGCSNRLSYRPILIAGPLLSFSAISFSLGFKVLRLVPQSLLKSVSPLLAGEFSPAKLPSNRLRLPLTTPEETGPTYLLTPHCYCFGYC